MTTPLPPNDPPRSDEPLPGEAELAALYRELPRSEPSPALDAAVLRAAAAALAPSGDPTVTERRKAPREPGDWVHPKPVSAVTAKAIPSIDGAPRRRRAPPWLITLGSAASLVLVAGLAWQLRESSPPPSAPVAAPEATTPATSDMASREAATPLAGTTAPAPAAQPTPRLADQRAALQAAAAKKMKQDSAVQSARRAAAAKPMAAPPPLAEVAAPAPQVQYAPPPPPAPPAPPAPPQEVSANAAASGMLDQADQPAASSAAAGEQATAARPGDAPAQELDKIRQLFAQGQHDEALQRLRAFRQAHPQWPLPAELQAQLQEP
ncbi:hypothetical protein ABNK63_08170 [Rhodanobacter sp. IGA1.0]|uniref:Uncharacterized protein n=1 Tax=Rhodanobacter sp. IGA1.0 TaxID=3158582 RepID=A0AAU7QQE1_9GAMM